MDQNPYSKIELVDEREDQKLQMKPIPVMGKRRKTFLLNFSEAVDRQIEWMPNILQAYFSGQAPAVVTHNVVKPSFKLQLYFYSPLRSLVNTDKHHVTIPKLYDLGDATTQPNMYHLEATRSSVEATPHKRELPLYYVMLNI